jgi:hypothetical protein
MKGLYDEAFAHFLQSSHLNPDARVPWLCLARILATHPDPELRTANRAFLIVDQALESSEYRSRAALDELAAAYFVRGSVEQRSGGEGRSLSE